LEIAFWGIIFKLETMRGGWSKSAAGQIETTPAHPAQLPAHLEKFSYRRTTMFANVGG
jgi:hypothetical protein